MTRMARADARVATTATRMAGADARLVVAGFGVAQIKSGHYPPPRDRDDAGSPRGQPRGAAERAEDARVRPAAAADHRRGRRQGGGSPDDGPRLRPPCPTRREDECPSRALYPVRGTRTSLRPARACRSTRNDIHHRPQQQRPRRDRRTHHRPCHRRGRPLHTRAAEGRLSGPDDGPADVRSFANAVQE
jgi:hypothetical protein